MQIEITRLESLFWIDLAEKTQARFKRRAHSLERTLLLDLTQRFIEKLKSAETTCADTR